MDNSGQTFALRVCRSLLCGVCGGGDVVCRVQCDVVQLTNAWGVMWCAGYSVLTNAWGVM